MGCLKCDMFLLTHFVSAVCMILLAQQLFLCILTQHHVFVKIPNYEIRASPSSVTRGQDCTSCNTDCYHLQPTGGFCCDTLRESRVGFFGLSNGIQMPRILLTHYFNFYAVAFATFFFFSQSIFLFVAAFKHQP